MKKRDLNKDQKEYLENEEKYLSFSDKIERDLKKKLELLQELMNKDQSYEELKQWIELNPCSDQAQDPKKPSSKPKRTKGERLVELEKDVFIQAEYNITGYVNLELGLNLFVELTYEEALKQIPQLKELNLFKMQNLAREIDEIQQIKAKFEQTLS